MMATTPKILIVDDEEQNLEIIAEYLEEENLDLDLQHDSLKAWQVLEKHPTAYDVILLDWMMPELDGLELLGRIKQHPDMKHTPVIMQTARNDRQDILRGLAAGAFYYLTKPYNQAALSQIIQAALDDIQRFQQLARALEIEDSESIETQAEFSIRNLNEADQLASLLANNCPEPGKVISGISELLINSIEHGNLHIGYAEKAELKKRGKWREEIEGRLQQAEYATKSTKIKFTKNGSSIAITITDQGKGFKWQKFLEFDPERAFDCNGRGIAMANMLSFDELRYNDSGNEVTAIIKI